MSRSIWKGPCLDKTLMSIKQKSIKKIKIFSRSSTIPEFLMGKLVYVHNGKEFKALMVTREKIGFKFGEFSFTRKNRKAVQKVVKPIKK